MWNKIIEMLKAWLKKEKEKIDPKPTPKPNPAPTPEPNPAPDTDVLRKIQWLGKNFSNAPETARLEFGTLTHNSFGFYPAAPASWPVNGGEVRVQGQVCLFYERGGQIVGGKFDWVRPNQMSKDLKNLRGGYYGHCMPKPGAKCWAMLVDVWGAQRTNLIEVKRK